MVSLPPDLLKSIYVSLDFDSRASLARTNSVFRPLWKEARDDPTCDCCSQMPDQERYSVQLGARLFRRRGGLYHSMQMLRRPVLGCCQLAMVTVRITLRPEDIQGVHSWWQQHRTHGSLCARMSCWTACDIHCAIAQQLPHLEPGDSNFRCVLVTGEMLDNLDEPVGADECSALELIFMDMGAADAVAPHNLWYRIDTRWLLLGPKSAQPQYWRMALGLAGRAELLVQQPMCTRCGLQM